MGTIKEKSYTFESFQKRVKITVEHLPSEQRIQFLASELMRELNGYDGIKGCCEAVYIFGHRAYSESEEDFLDVRHNSDDDDIRVPYLYGRKVKERGVSDEEELQEMQSLEANE